jgi:hypothetical protein
MEEMRIVIIVLGSTKFRKEIVDWAWQMTKEHYLVLFAPFAKEEITDVEQYREELEIQHFQKIRMADIVWVFNKNGYIGNSTKREIEYAKNHYKLIKYLEPIQ